MIVVALGSNLVSRAGAPRDTLLAALQALASNAAMPIKVSRFYKSPAWPNPKEPPFINAVAQIETGHSPSQLMRVLHQVEITFGRERDIPNAPRTLDLDLIDYNGRIEAGPPVLPHPRLESRAFVLLPLAEVVPDWVHPVTKQTLKELIAALPARDVAQTEALLA